jgi:hypothetical protein
LAIASISKITNALVEAGLILATVMLGLLGLTPFALGAMVGVALLWWGFVHSAKIASMFAKGPAGALGSAVLAWVLIVIVHGFAFALGGAFHSLMGLK